MGDEIGKFLQAKLQPTLQDIERQLTPRQAVSERTQTLMVKVLEAKTSVQANEIDFWATNILDERNGEARRREIQCPSLLPVTLVPFPDEVLKAKRCSIDKNLQSEQALALYNFRIGEGMLAHFTERKRNQRELLQPRYEFNNLALEQRSRIAHAVSTGYCQKRHSEQRCDTNYKPSIWNPTVGKIRVKTKRFRQLTPSAIWKQVMRPMLNQNKNQTFAQNQEFQIKRIQDDIPPPNSGPRDQPPPGHRLYAQRNAAIPHSIIFPPTLNAEQEIPGINNIY
ncbi:MAG: hypothetical protein EZS28_010208 [Streblomastix strix]|uniref:Uncharacterized protein n=1 Tax=Streblomastix strix TaxID=222440 RepID=A0A5J4WGS2_9EUKA|nr:MAG: hypothetical protein EZS28_010208 [Streblomastix strix]